MNVNYVEKLQTNKKKETKKIRGKKEWKNKLKIFIKDKLKITDVFAC